VASYSLRYSIRFFHQWNLNRPLTNGLKLFRMWLRIRWDIRFESLQIWFPRGHWQNAASKNPLNWDFHQKGGFLCNNFLCAFCYWGTVSLYFWNQHKILWFFYTNHDLLKKFFFSFKLTKFLGAFTIRLWGRRNFFNACSGLPMYWHNYLKILEFANKIFFKINSPYWRVYKRIYPSL
jgi:hypothetical protein